MRKHRNTQNTSSSQGTVRIIGGQWRGRKLHFDDEQGLRPTPDRIRETVFNWITPYLAESRCLDLFCGSAALGFEALSRGADFVQFVDKSASVARNWCNNQEKFACYNALFSNSDAIKWLEKSTEQPFTIVFIDPPYANMYLNATFTALNTSSILAPDGLIYFEHPKEEQPLIPANWVLFREKQAGKNRYCIYQQKENAL